MFFFCSLGTWRIGGKFSAMNYGKEAFGEQNFT